MTEGSHFKSPPLLLLAKLHDTFVVLEDQSRKDIVVVIPDSEVLRADYLANGDQSMDSGPSR